MKARIVNKNALRLVGTDFADYGMVDYAPILVGKINLKDVNTISVITSGSTSLMFDVYLFSMDLKNAI